MFQSMTGYGKAQGEGRMQKVVVEARSVNSRHLDIKLRLPMGSWALESMIRKRVQERFIRGRIDISVTTEPLLPDEEPPLDFQLGRAKSYLKALEELKTECGIDGKVDLHLMSSFRDLFKIKDVTLEEELQALEAGLEGALQALESMRRTEGRALKEDLGERIDWMMEQTDLFRSTAPKVTEAQVERFNERIEKLLGDRQIDPGRLEQEVALLIDRLDVTEEIVRLQSHIEQFAGLLSEGRGVGKKLEFLLQEMHREANTLGTKAADAQLTHNVIEMKAQIERMREQTQNIE